MRSAFHKLFLCLLLLGLTHCQKRINVDLASDSSQILVPEAPVINSIAVQEGQAIISWTAPEVFYVPAAIGKQTKPLPVPKSNWKGAITDYVVQYSSDNGVNWTTFSKVPSNSTTVTVTGLNPGTSYIFRVAAVGVSGTGKYTTSQPTATPIVKPGSPIQIAGTPGSTQVKLTWQPPASNGGGAITDYVIQYSDDNQNWANFSDGISNASEATVTGLTDGTSYLFRVAAVNSSGQGPFSTSSWIITQSNNPSAPLNITGLSGNASVTLSWNLPVSNGSSPITDYAIQYRMEGSASWVLIADPVSALTSSSVTGLLNGVSYYFRVAAINSAGTGKYSLSSGAIMPTGASAAPIGVTGAAGNGQVVLSWSAPTNNGGISISDYVVQYSSNNGVSWLVFNDGTSNATTAAVSGLSNGTQYIFRVAALNAAGLGAYSDSSSGVTPYSVPGLPLNVVGSAGNAQVSVSWTSPSSTGGNAITDYVIQYSSNNGNSWTTFNEAVSIITNTTVTGLTNGVSYVFRVAAVNSAGTGNYGASSSSVVPFTVPQAPTVPVGTAGNTQVALSWSAPSDNGGALITDYAIQVSSNGGTNWVPFTDGVSPLASGVVTGLINGTAYVFRVAAVNAAGTGTYSTASLPIIPLGFPLAPAAPSGTPGNKQIVLNWTAPTNSGGSPITDYVIQYSVPGTNTWTTFPDGTSTSTTVNVTGLSNGTQYVFRVAAVNAIGPGSYSPNSSAISPIGVSGAPTNVSGVAGNAQIALTWTAPTSNGGSSIMDYMIQYSSDDGGSWLLFDDGISASASATVTGLTNGTQYVFKVAAVNAAGISSYSDKSLSFTPFASASAPLNLIGIAGNAQVFLTWSPPVADGGSVITDYVIQFSSDNGNNWSNFSDETTTVTSSSVTGLTNGTSYVFRVAAVNANGAGTYSANSSALIPFTVPGAPTNQVATAGNKQVSIAWTAPANNGGRSITDYVIQYSSNGGTSWVPFTDGVSTLTSAVVTGLTNGTSYVFQVAAVNSAGTGSYSASSSATVPLGVPTAPTALTGTAGNMQVALSWTAPSNNGGSAITDYTIQFSLAGSNTWTTFSDGISTNTTATVTGLTNGSSYVFQVAALSSIGPGNYSATSSTIIPVGSSDAPTSVSGVAGNGQVEVSWTAPLNNGGIEITDYVIQFSSNSGTNWSTFSDGTSTTTKAMVTGLTNGTSYVFRVAAVNSIGTGPYSSNSSSVTPYTFPGIPLSVVGTAGNAQVSLSWNAPASNGGNAITDYLVQFSSDNGSSWGSFSDGVSNATTATVTGLTNGTSYVFRVAAVNTAGTGAYSANSSSVSPIGASDAPTSVTGSPGNTQVSLTWSAPTNNGGLLITDYAIQYSSNGGTNWLTFSDGVSTATSTVVTGLANGTSYVFRVAAVNSVGTGSYSASSLPVIPLTTPGSPTSVSGTAGNTQVSLSWSAPSSNGGSAISDYIIQVSNDNGSNWTTFNDGVSTATTATITGLTNGSSYLFKVAAVNAAGTGSYSANSSVVVPLGVPSSPTGVTGTAQNAQVALTWSTPSTNGGSAITDYLIQYSSNSGGVWTTFNDGVSTALSATVTGLSNGTSYIFRVAAINAIGTGSYSANSSAFTPSGTISTPPSAPTGLTGTLGSTQVSLNWSVPTNNGGEVITDYIIQYSSNDGSTWLNFTDGVNINTSTVVTGLANGTPYLFRVAAVNSVGTGTYAQTATAITPAAAPGTPTNLIATAGQSQVTVSWTAPANNGSPISDYLIQYSSNGGTNWTTFNDGVSTATNATVTGLVIGTTYIFQVAAVNAVGNGAYSSSSSGAVPYNPPGAPTGLTGTSGYGQVVLNWTAPSSNGGSSISDYTIQYRVSTDTTWTTFNDGTSTSVTATVTGLDPNSLYVFRVAAVNGGGPGAYSTESSTVSVLSYWYQEAYLKAPNAEANDQFGISLAASGDTIVIGAHLEDNGVTTITNGTLNSSDPFAASNSGAAYVFKRTGSTWTAEAYLKASNTGVNDYFGFSTSISGDAIVVGAYLEDNSATTITNGNYKGADLSAMTDSGAAYVFKRTGNTWAQEAYLKASNPDISDWFGYSTAISGDTIVVGALYEDSVQTTITNGTTSSADNTVTDAGAVYVYRRFDNRWKQEAYLKASNPTASDQFGNSVGISGDTIVVGARYEDSSETTITSGTTAAADVSTISNYGAAYVFKRTGTTWAQEAYLKASNSGANDNFGFVAGISGDTVAVGAPYEDSNQNTITNGTTSAGDASSDFGAVYVFKRTGTAWAQEAYLKASNSGSGDYFGYSVGISGDTIVAGAYREDNGQTVITNGLYTSVTDATTATDTGAAYVFKRTGSTWAQVAYLKTPNPSASDNFGYSSAITGDTIAVGSYLEDSNQTTITNGSTASIDDTFTSSGAVYVFRRPSISGLTPVISSVSPAQGSASGGSLISVFGSGFVNGATVTVGGRACTNLIWQNNYELLCTLPSGSSGSAAIVVTNPSGASTSNSSSFAYSITEPSGLTATVDDKTQITLNWNPAETGSSTTVFQISYVSGTTAPANCTTGSIVSAATVGSATSYTVTGLSPSQTDYSFRICNFVNSSFSTGSTITVNTGWYQEAYLKAPNAEASDLFGATTAISGDTIVVGAYQESSNQTTITNGSSASSNNSLLYSGAAYVFKRTGKVWAQEAYLKAPNPSASDYFGYNTSIYGNTIVVGAHLEDSNQTTITNGTSASLDGNVTDSGAAYVFKRAGSTWAQEAYLKASNANGGDYFGFDTAIAGDTIVVGAHLEDSSQTTISNGSSASASNATADAGAAYVFKRSGSTWAQEAYLKAVNAGGSDYFGYNAAISGDTIVVGAYLEDSSQTTIINGTTASGDNSVSDSGAAYVFKRTGGSWVQEAYLKAPSVTASDWFGYSTAISGDTIVVGALYEDSPQTTVMNGTTVNTANTLGDSGAAYVFKRTGSNWVQEAFLKASNPTASDRFGVSTAISADTIVVGAHLEDSNQTTITNGTTSTADNSITDSGAAYVFKRNGNIWAQEAYLKAAVPRASDNFGYSTSISGDTIVVGAWTEDSRETTISNASDAAGTNTSASNSGAVYVFRRPPTVGLSPTISSIVAQGSTLDGSLLSVFGSGFMRGATVSIGGVSCVNPTWISYNEISCTFTSGSFQNSFLIVTNPNGNTTNAYFDPSNFVPNPKTLTATVNHSTQITLNWTSNGGSTAGFRLAYQSGITAPADCLSGTQLDVSGAGTTSVAITGLTRVQDYAFRLCAKDASGNISSGITVNATTGWYQEAYLKAPNGDSGDYFGRSTAISGDTIVIGASSEDSNQTTITNGSFVLSADNSTTDSGAAYVFKRNGSNWVRDAYLKPSNSSASDQFGYYTAISSDTIVVSTPYEDSNQTTITNGTSASADNSVADSGAAYVFRRIGTTWAQEAYLKAPNPDASDQFGYSSAISGDTIVVGAVYEDSAQNTITNGTIASLGNTATDSGAAYVFKRTGTTWAQEAYLKAPNVDSGDYFGSSTGISGNTIVVSAPYEDSNQTTITNAGTGSADNSIANSGAAYVFKRSGSLWAQEAYLKAPSITNSDRFGFSTAISGDTVVVAAPYEDSNQTTITNGTTGGGDVTATSEFGAAYVFKRTDSTWIQEAYLKAPNSGAGDLFGWSTAISGDTIVVGATGDDSSQNTITNGTVVGTDNSFTDTGSAYVFRRTGSTWAQEAYLRAPNSDTSDLFGSSTSVSGDTVVVGAPYEDSNQTTITNGTSASVDNSLLDIGAVYVFRRAPTTGLTPAITSVSLSQGSASGGQKISIFGSGFMNGATVTMGGTACSNLTWQSYNEIICDTPAGSAGLASIVVTNPGGATTTNSSLFTYLSSDPPNPFNFVASVKSSTQINLSWSSGGGTTASFQVAYSTGNTPPANCSTGTVIDYSTIGSGTSLAVTGLTTQDYAFRLCARNASGSLSSGVTTLGSTGWYHEAYIKAPNALNADQFGYSTAISGDTVVVGAPYEDSNQTTITNGTTAGSTFTVADSGAAYVFKRTGSTWAQEAYLKAVNANTLDYFGSITAISGETIVVGAYGEDSAITTITNGTTASTSNAYLSSGAAYVYKRSGTTWAQEAFLKASNNTTSGGADQFGYSLAISGDTIVVGAPYEDSNVTTITNGLSSATDVSTTSNFGAAYVFKRTGNTWAQEAFLKAPNSNASDLFGWSTAISGDTIVVGATGEASNQTTITNGATASSNNSLTSSGAAYVFKRTGSTWAQEAYLKAPNTGVLDYFGYNVAISGDTIAVGAYGEDSNQTYITSGASASADDSMTDSGAVYVFKRTGSTWAQEAYLKASNPTGIDYFGFSTAISSDTIAVGAYLEDSNQTTITNGTSSAGDAGSDFGAAYVFKRTGTSWAQEAYLKAPNSDQTDSFGYSISIDGDSIVVGAIYEDSLQTSITNGPTASLDNTQTNTGAVYVFRRAYTFTFPGAPTSVSGIAGNFLVTLGWSAPSNGGSNITDYIIQFSSDGGVNWTTFGDGVSTATGTTVTGLVAGTAYVFRVAAVNTVGQGVFSAQTSSLTPTAPTVSCPSGMNCYSAAVNSVIGTETTGPGGVKLTLQYANGSSGFKIWREKNGSRILNASGDIANGWQKMLVPAGTAFDASDLTDPYIISQLAGRVCPPNVFLNYSTMRATGRCVYYDIGNGTQALNRYYSSASGTEGIYWLTYWDSFSSGRGTSSSYYEGNVQACAEKGMRLPVAYETDGSGFDLNSYNNSPTGDSITPSWGDATSGVPPVVAGQWSFTASANISGATLYWVWGGTDPTTINANGPYSTANSIRCILPSH